MTEAAALSAVLGVVHRTVSGHLLNDGRCACGHTRRKRGSNASTGGDEHGTASDIRIGHGRLLGQPADPRRAAAELPVRPQVP